MLIIYVIQYTIYFTFESIIFRSYRHCVLKGDITIKRKRRKRKALKDRSSQGVVDLSEGGRPTFGSVSFHNH